MQRYQDASRELAPKALTALGILTSIRDAPAYMNVMDVYQRQRFASRWDRPQELRWAHALRLCRWGYSIGDAMRPGIAPEIAGHRKYRTQDSGQAANSPYTCVRDDDTPQGLAQSTTSASGLTYIALLIRKDGCALSWDAGRFLLKSCQHRLRSSRSVRIRTKFGRIGAEAVRTRRNACQNWPAIDQTGPTSRTCSPSSTEVDP